MIRSARPIHLPRRFFAIVPRSVLAARSMPAVKSTITPTDREEKLFRVLKGTLKHAELDTILRCAGGWVRDKLLGKESHDIDIAIDNMLGREFAEHVNSYLLSQNIDTHRVRRQLAQLLDEPLCLSWHVELED